MSAVTAGALLLAGLLIAVASPHGVAGQSPSLTPPPVMQASPEPLTETVQGPGSVSLPPGGGVAFVFGRTAPLAQPTAQPGTIATPTPPPPTLFVRSQSDQPAAVTYDGAVLTIAAPVGFTVQVRLGDVPAFGGCAAVDGQTNVVECQLPVSPPVDLTFLTVAADAQPQTAELPGYGAIALVSLVVGTSDAASVTVASKVGGASLTWDGTILTIAAPAGFSVQALPTGFCQPDPGVNRASCQTAPGANGPVTVTTSPPPSVTVPGRASLPPGGGVAFSMPYNCPPPRPGQPPPPCPPVRPPLVVQSESDQPVEVAYDGQALTIAGPDGFAIPVVSSTGSFEGCTAIDSQPNQVSCAVSSGFGGSSGVVSFKTAADESSPQIASVPPGGAVSFIGPAAPGAESSDLPAVTVRSGVEQPATATWDGSSLTLAAPDGFVVSLQSVESGGQQLSPTDAGCSPANDLGNVQGAVVSCTLTGVPPVQVTFTTAIPAPAGSLTFPYADSDGAGTLTISNDGPDIAPGGARIAVTLTQSGVTLTGEGVLRREQVSQQHAFQFNFSLADPPGDSYLFEGVLVPDGDAWSGKGLWLSETDPTLTDSWAVGSSSQGGFTSGIMLSAEPGTLPQNPPSLGSPLPQLAGHQLVGPFAGPAGEEAPVAPPTVGAASQPIGFAAVTVVPCCGPEATQTYQWNFGDGSSSPPSEQQTANHSYAAPGIYIVSVIVIDSAGVSSFAVTQIQIDPPAPGS